MANGINYSGSNVVQVTIDNNALLTLNKTTNSISSSANLAVSSITSSFFTGSFSGNGLLLSNLTASRISNFQNDVRNQFSNGTGISITNGQINTSNIPNSSLQNSSITINGSAISLGGSTTITSNTAQTASSVFYDSVTGIYSVNGNPVKISNTIIPTVGGNWPATGPIDFYTFNGGFVTYNIDPSTLKMRLDSAGNLTLYSGNQTITGSLIVSSNISSSGNISGIHYGDGSNLTGVTKANINSGVANYITYYSSSNTLDDTGIYWDNTNQRMSIGGSITPVGTIQVGRSDNSGGSDGSLIVARSDGSSRRQFRIAINPNFDLCMGDFGIDNTSGSWKNAFKVNFNAPDNSLYVTTTGLVSSSVGFAGDATNLINVAKLASANTFTANQIITGSLAVSSNISTFGSITSVGNITSSANISGVHYGDGSNLTGIAKLASANTFTANQTITGSLAVSSNISSSGDIYGIFRGTLSKRNFTIGSPISSTTESLVIENTLLNNTFGGSYPAAGPIDFYTAPAGFYSNGTEARSLAMRISGSGNVLIGLSESTGSYKLQVNSQIWATNATIATPSDISLKKDIEPLTDGLSIINSLKPSKYNWKPHETLNFDTANKQIGFIAQEVQEIIKEKDYAKILITENNGLLNFSEGKLIPLLVKAVQELSAKVEQLENKLSGSI